MELKEQIEKTIQAYEEACKKENLNIEYCKKNKLQGGICFYAIYNDFEELGLAIESIIKFGYLVVPPIFIGQKYLDDGLIKNPTILKCHKARIKFLKQLLKDQK